MKTAIMSEGAAKSLGMPDLAGAVVEYVELVNGVAQKVFHKGTLIADEIPISDITGIVNLSEPVLEPSYPINAGYWYIANGAPLQSPVSGTAETLKRWCEDKMGMKNVVIRRCDAFKRGLKLY